MVEFQKWLVHTFAQAKPIASFMRGWWQWPAAESLHFIGLSLIVGTIVVFDLRLLGIGRRISIAAVHRLIPFGLLGFGLNVITGMMFLLTEPDQYVYNVSFHFKVLFMAIAGLNASAFYLTSYRKTTGEGAPVDAPTTAKVIAVISICMWIGVILAGRLLTFYRPYPCEEAGEPGFIATCLPGYYSH